MLRLKGYGSYELFELKELTQHVLKDDSPELAKTVAAAYFSEVYKLQRKIYAYGSKTANRAGFAFNMPSLSISQGRRCSTTLTVFSIELLTIRHALTWIYIKDHP